MYSLMAYIAGLLLALMVFSNGITANASSIYISALFYQGIGLLVFFIADKSSVSNGSNDLSFKINPLFKYLPGVLSALTIVLSNIAINTLGVTLMVAISLLGQVIASLIIDSFGFLGKEKTPFEARSLISILVMTVGVILII